MTHFKLLEAQQALLILDALADWCGLEPGRTLTVQHVVRGRWVVRLDSDAGEEIECSGSTLKDALGQVATVVLLEVDSARLVDLACSSGHQCMGVPLKSIDVTTSGASNLRCPVCNDTMRVVP